MDFREQTLADFEAQGAEMVRLRLQAHLVASSQVALALEWLRTKDAETAQLRSRRAKARTSREIFTIVMMTATVIITVLTLILQLRSEPSSSSSSSAKRKSPHAVTAAPLK